jgi:aspartokinase
MLVLKFGAFDDEAAARHAATALAGIADTSLRTDLALLAAIGEGVASSSRVAWDMLDAADGVAIAGLACPAGGSSLRIMVDDADLADAMGRVYGRFYPAAVAAGSPASGMFLGGTAS